MTKIEPLMQSLSVVMPLYRESCHLDNTLQEIIRVLNDLEIEYEVILVDDGSPDKTWQVILSLCKSHPAVFGIRLSRNFGKEAAIAAGLSHAKGRAVILMDGDLQHPPGLIAEMMAHWRAGADIVEAVKRFREEESWFSRIRAKIFNTFFSYFSGFDLHDASDFKLMDHRVLEAWRSMGERNLFFRGMCAWLGFKRVQIQFDVRERVDGQSNWSLMQLVRLAVTAVTSFSSVPLHLVTLTGIAFTFFAIILGIQTLYLKFSGNAIDGFTTVILLLLVIGAVVMLGLGIIGTYITRIYEEVKARPRFIVAERSE